MLSNVKPAPPPSSKWFSSSPEYLDRVSHTNFKPPSISIKDVHAAVPRHLFERNTLKSIFYVARHLALTALFFWYASRIDSITIHLSVKYALRGVARATLSWILWGVYWFWQSVSFTGIWTLGHECGHDSLSPYSWVNAIIGVGLHTFMTTPYYAWRVTHRNHHKGTNHLDRDETYHPFTRTDLKLPPANEVTRMHYKEIIEETPAYTIFKLVVRQFLGFQLYLIHNRKGNPKYPKGTSHYKPSSKPFKPEHRNGVIISDICIATILTILTCWSFCSGFTTVWRMYWVPWLWAHNWIVMFTYLQHSDPTIPYYRKGQWTFTRGALATVDRPVFGWIGTFFWHGIAHHHVAHHFFVSIPFYNLSEVTKAIIPVLGEHYCYDTTPTLFAVLRSFTQCTFIEPEGDVVFFKNQQGEALRDYNPPTPGLSPDNQVKSRFDQNSKDGGKDKEIEERLKGEHGIGYGMDSED